MYIISGEFSFDDVISITPLPNAYGNDLVTLWLTDSDGYTAKQPLWINISPVNDKPIFSNPPDLIVHYNEDYTFNYEPYVYDIDNTIEELIIYASERISSLDSTRSTTQGEHIRVDRMKITYNFPKEYLDKHILVSLILFDGESSDGKTIQVNVTEDYTPVLKKELPDIMLEEGETLYNVFDLDDYFDDPDQDSLFYSFGETHIIVVIKEDHFVDIISPSNWNGVDTVTFRARDPVGALAEDTILVTVSPVNDPPIISGVPDRFVIHYESDYSFDLTPYISDEDNTHDELYLILSDDHVRIDPLNKLKIIMNYPKSMLNMDVPVILMVSDGIDNGFQIVNVLVTDTWPPDVTHDLPDVSFYEDESLLNVFNLNDYFTDRDSHTLYYSYGNKYVNVVINSDDSVDISAEPNWYGVEIITFRATDDSAAFTENVITVTVKPINDPPIIQPLPDQNRTVKELWKFDLTKYILDVDNNISELLITVESSKLDIVLSGTELLIYSDTPVEDYIIIRVSDGLDETSETMFINIIDLDSKPSSTDSFLMSMLWILILAIIIIAVISGFMGYKRYFGDYNVQEIFWIFKNGILISHIINEESTITYDKEIVSGMLTAILDFSEDAFKDEGISGTTGRIKEIQMDERSILVERGENSFLATVFTGRSGKKLYFDSRKVMQEIEKRYGFYLQTWKGQGDKLIGMEDIIKKLIPPKNN
jgi:hypothetical protein